MDNQNKSLPSYFSITPAPIRYCKELEFGARLLYGELTALSNIHGYCWATNAYFAELYDVDERTIRRWLESLQQMNFIYVEFEKKTFNAQRKIFINMDFQKSFTEGQKCPGGRTKMSGGADKNVLHNRTRSSTLDIDVSGDGGSAAPERASPTANLEEKKIKVRGPRNSSTILTKEGIKNTAALKQHDWKDEEIDYAIEVIANHNEPISNWLSFLAAVIKNLRNDKRKQEHQGGKTCKNKSNKIKLPPEEPGIRTHEGVSMDSGTLSSLIASRPNIFQEFCYPRTSNGS
jgi:hypothetical protein